MPPVDLQSEGSAPSGRLLSHSNDPSTQDEQALTAVRARLLRDEAHTPERLDALLCLVDAMSTFELGRFLLHNRGLNAHWAHQMVTYQPGTLARDTAPMLEHALFERIPLLVATRHRFGIFQHQLQALLRPGMTLVSVACGFMGELLMLDYRHCPDVRLLGTDLDPQALDGARALARQRGLEHLVSLQLQDAWEAGEPGSADVLTSNGLNIYEPDDARVLALYRVFFDWLRPGGTLVTSFLTPPPQRSDQSPWKLEAVDASNWHLQELLTKVSPPSVTFRTQAQTLELLQRAGYGDVTFIDDPVGVFPTVVARKPPAA
ncbi:class I SAM-dependent methyltransferase [Xanthomonas campestris pv. badrii]|uniref:Class I SAM-dependent methyltransferase n=1 Tax=Xanthomonas campestris pv. badrii TaxID=149696 RepID=A0A7Z2V983_XANCA|nr:class I SAM-dependent methyltransferase [Xanthomonas campestris]MCC4605334.1 class I SAM-dependent methyltransferase [Xanthomonas campestris pv. parthenii]QJD67382.1 class I SAM-dependent methyltransferase [Xanthomonas campestris pv. badrii]